MGYFDKHLTIKLLYSQQFSDSKIASPLRCNRDAVTVQSRCRYGVIATRLHRNGNGFLAKKLLAMLQKGTSEPFSRSKSTSYQVLNFGNNILHLNIVLIVLFS